MLSSFTAPPRSSSSKRGFNGQERKDDYKGVGNHNHALYWEYDTRIGRRWNLDPKPNVSFSGYSVMEANPIWKNDLMGDIPLITGAKKQVEAFTKMLSDLTGNKYETDEKGYLKRVTIPSYTYIKNNFVYLQLLNCNQYVLYMKYKFTIQYCASNGQKPEVMLQCVFDAPDEATADQLFEAICENHTRMIPKEPTRTYEQVREWKMTDVIA